MSKPRILAFAGSVRKDSYNHRLLLVAAEGERQDINLGAGAGEEDGGPAWRN